MDIFILYICFVIYKGISYFVDKFYMDMFLSILHHVTVLPVVYFALSFLVMK